MESKTLVLLCALVLGSGNCLAGGNPVLGREKAVAICGACHGVDGNSVAPTFPRLAGQHEGYLLHALNSYRNGTRKNEIMKAQVALLTASDMANLAAYFAEKKGLEVKQ